MRFDEIIDAVLDGKCDAGLLIHEGQITYKDYGLTKVLDLWEWWSKRFSLPLPLGLNAIRRDLSDDVQKEFLRAMRKSVEYALKNVDEAMKYAMKFARNLDIERAKKFALMYVNTYTVEMSRDVIEALDSLYKLAEKKGLIKKPVIDIL